MKNDLVCLILFFMTSIANAYSGQVTLMQWRDGFSKEHDFGEFCMKEGRLAPGETCIFKDFSEVPKPDGKGVGKVHWVVTMPESGSDRYGLANEDGDILIKPAYGAGVILTTRSMLLCETTECYLYTADGKKTSVGKVKFLELPNSPPILLVEKKDDKGRDGLAPLHFDGTLGPILVGAVMDEAFATGDLGVFKVHESPKVAASVMLDLRGEIVWAGGELKVFEIPIFENQYGNIKGTAEKRTTLMIKAAAPINSLPSDPYLYMPMNGTKPMELPKDVVGVMPANLILANNTNAVVKRPDAVMSWIIVKKEKNKFRYFMAPPTSGATLDVLLKDLPKYEEIDDVKYYFKNAWDEDSTVAMTPTYHRVKNKDWKMEHHGKEALGKTADLCFSHWQDLVKETLKKDIAQQQAVAKYEHDERVQKNTERKARDMEVRAEKVAQYNKNYAKDFDKECSLNCGPIEDAAFYMGDPVLTEYLSHQTEIFNDVNHRVEQACAISATACEQAKRLVANVHSRWDAEAAQRSQLENGYKAYTEQKIKEIQKGNDYTVPYYEGGRLKYKTMSSDEYHRTYGN